MAELRREPFRLLFPLGALLALAGVLPWLLFGTGVTRLWLGTYHALTLTQGFLVAVAAGFLGTMLPRRSGTAPFTRLELALIALSLLTFPAALLADRLLFAELANLVGLLTLTQFALRRVRHRKAAGDGRPLPPSFLLIPCALLSGVAGALLLIVASLAGPAWAMPLGRAFAQEGVLLPLVMALGPMLTPVILDGQASPDRSAPRVYLLAAALLLASFALPLRLGELLRGLLTAVVAVGAIRTPRAPGLHRRLFQLSMLLVPVGLVASAALPVYRIPLLHLSFIGGLSLMVFAVGAHVTFLHTGHERLAMGRPWPLALVGLLTIAAAVTRATAERLFSAHYVQALAVAATLWLAAALLWALYLGPMFVRGKRA